MKLLLIAYALGLAHAAAIAGTSPNDEAGVSPNNGVGLEARDDCPNLYTCYRRDKCAKHSRPIDCLYGRAKFRDCPLTMTHCDADCCAICPFRDPNFAYGVGC
ncbi:unnamed protein product [Zymoseptoria tritici ST99CH_3D7]|uniref:Uncharacterized protein n=1 Tax=Zymoseptoria tritici (strain ST99CH_3D7) TaxID=1276538 RepID=A0A1X7S137_ZYMT9|nr:unnamed protein product [Zymoseptoria tritici ST99CH_3D7]